METVKAGRETPGSIASPCINPDKKADVLSSLLDKFSKSFVPKILLMRINNIPAPNKMPLYKRVETSNRKEKS